MRRKPIVAGNWKMNTTVGSAIDLAAEVKRGMAELDTVEAVLAPPFTALKSVGDLIRFGNVGLAAQDVHWEAVGAFTGEISGAMLRDLACDYVIVGHSERRVAFGETDEVVGKKTKAAFDAGITPIVCVGETLEERDAGSAEEVLRRQVTDGLGGFGARLGELVIAYEPVWAIGTGRTAAAAEAQAAHAFIRSMVGDLGGADAAESVRLQYGGSVKPGNAAELFGQPDIDGGLIGGASLTADSFLRIVQAAAE